MTAAIASCLGPFSPLYLKCVASKALESVGVKPVGYVESCSMPSCVACQVSRAMIPIIIHSRLGRRHRPRDASAFVNDDTART